MPAVIETVDLTKTYNGNTAVDKLNLRIEEESFLAFLVPMVPGRRRLY